MIYQHVLGQNLASSFKVNKLTDNKKAPRYRGSMVFICSTGDVFSNYASSTSQRYIRMQENHPRG